MKKFDDTVDDFFVEGYLEGWNDAIDRACEGIEQQVSDMYGIAEEVEKLKRKDNARESRSVRVD